MSRRNLVPKLLLAATAVVVAIPFFWLLGGVRWMETEVFPPRRPRNMPDNSIWIDAPAVSLSWHRGWWFGCGISSSGITNFCRLVGANGQEVYAGEYLSCTRESPIPLSSLKLVRPPDPPGLWITDKRLAGLAPIGTLESGAVLLPVVALELCAK
jgi:hypothetical protein